MFLGHYAVALGVKRRMPRVSLGVLVAATSLVDLLWPIFLLVGWERLEIAPGNTAATPLNFVHYPITHSLLGAVGWSLLFSFLYWRVTRYAGGAVAVGLVTVSHWFLDAIVHRPDLPLYPGSPVLVGLGLWDSVVASVILECAMFAAGVWLYAAGTRARDGAGRYAFWGFVLFLALAYAGNVVGPPPPSWQAVAWLGLSLWILPFWAEWFDRHRDRTAQMRTVSA